MVRKNNTFLNENAVFLISGGAKGITSQCAIKIAETARCRFILVGRSSVLDQEPDWAYGLSSTEDLQNNALIYYKNNGKKVTPKLLQNEIKTILSSREIASTIQEIEGFGGQAVYISADITDEKQLIQQVHSAVKKIGQITGVIHGAGNLADKLIENKSSNDFDLVVNTKIQGLINIIKAVNPEALKFLVLFSSVAGFFGNKGQSDYAIANELLNKSAHILNKSMPDCRVISINWGPWDSGMVSPELKKVFQKRNIQLISTEIGIQALIDELSRPVQTTPQILIGSPLGSEIVIKSLNNNSIVVRRSLNIINNPFLLDHRIGSQAVLPATCASSWLADTCQSLNPGFSFTKMEDFKILKGITFDDGENDYDMEINLQAGTDGSKKVYEAIITSQNNTNRKIFHYSGKITLTKGTPTLRRHQPIKDFDLDPSKYKNGRDFYQDGTLFHGPSFQGIQEVLQINEKRVITQVSLPQMDPIHQGQFSARIANPFINDAIVQSLLLWTQKFYDAPCLPSRLHQWDQYRLIPFDIPVWAILTITYHNDHAVVGNILVQDEGGGEFFTYTGLEGTISNHLIRFIGKKDS
ncbi:MAG: SDR family NAD(P)-dependent oxidoreductase [Pelolinea sp.]|nr:SDR family NAD(P)-dependent oxidoreductase [Pelolinea sp.]